VSHAGTSDLRRRHRDRAEDLRIIRSVDADGCRGPFGKASQTVVHEQVLAGDIEAELGDRRPSRRNEGGLDVSRPFRAAFFRHAVKDR